MFEHINQKALENYSQMINGIQVQEEIFCNEKTKSVESEFGGYLF